MKKIKHYLSENCGELVLGSIIITIMFVFPEEFKIFVQAFNDSPVHP